MKTRSTGHESTRTAYIHLDTRKCTACWKCLAECKNDVIGRINLPWHKHSRFVNSNECTGCLKCMKVCEPGALTKISDKKPDNPSPKRKIRMAFFVNLGLLISGLAMSISGFTVQFKYHMGHNTEIISNNSGFGMGYNNWTNIHKISIIIFSTLMTYHFITHWKWYKMIIVKKLASRNRLQIILTIVFILVAITGYVPWIVNISGGSDIARKFFIEIHDKITILLFALLSIHLSKKLRWYITVLERG